MHFQSIESAVTQRVVFKIQKTGRTVLPVFYWRFRLKISPVTGEMKALYRGVSKRKRPYETTFMQ
jgi:hypothetical protein